MNSAIVLLCGFGCVAHFYGNNKLNLNTNKMTNIIPEGTRVCILDKRGSELRHFSEILKTDMEDGIHIVYGIKYEIKNNRMLFNFKTYMYSVWNGLEWSHIYENIIQHESGSIHFRKN